jgi:hypothetical protein
MQVSVDAPQFGETLGTDDIVDDPALCRARDAVRAVLRRLPEVSAFEAMLPIRPRVNTAALKDAYDISMNRLRQLQQSLYVHFESFRRGRSYGAIFTIAANGIGGWFS